MSNQAKQQLAQYASSTLHFFNAFAANGITSARTMVMPLTRREGGPADGQEDGVALALLHSKLTCLYFIAASHAKATFDVCRHYKAENKEKQTNGGSPPCEAGAQHELSPVDVDCHPKTPT
jgi:hypothetical protein